MLTILLPEADGAESFELHLEHSLLSLSKWEAHYEKAFFSTEEKTEEESRNYVLQMILNPTIPPDLFSRLEPAHMMTIRDYINSKQSATWFREDPSRGGSREVVTSELIYYWLVQFRIPFHPTETWHLNRLMTLVKICGVKQTKPKKMSRAAQAQQMRELNAQRREQLGTSG